MTDAAFYPDIDDAAAVPFRVIQAQLLRRPDLLDDPRCPYSEDVRGLLRLLAPNTLHETPKQDETLDLSAQITLVLRQIQTLEQQGAGLSAKDRIQLLKAKPALIEKLVELTERANNARANAEFRRLVLEFIESELNPDQRTALMRRLRAHLESEP
jgi:hypothetical protein